MERRRERYENGEAENPDGETSTTSTTIGCVTSKSFTLTTTAAVTGSDADGDSGGALMQGSFVENADPHRLM
jgi:hypothetical protein